MSRQIKEHTCDDSHRKDVSIWWSSAHDEWCLETDDGFIHDVQFCPFCGYELAKTQ